jgi:transcriptional regulator with GAF, ATPase, and Fis domain
MARQIHDAMRLAISRALVAPKGTNAARPQRERHKTLPLRVAIESVERNLITQALAECGSFPGAAKALGVPSTTLKYKARKYGLASPSTRGRRV